MTGTKKQRLSGSHGNNGIYWLLMLFAVTLPQAVSGAEEGLASDWMATTSELVGEARVAPAWAVGDTVDLGDGREVEETSPGKSEELLSWSGWARNTNRDLATEEGAESEPIRIMADGTEREEKALVCSGASAPTLSVSARSSGVRVSWSGGSVGNCSNWELFRRNGVATSDLDGESDYLGCADDGDSSYNDNIDDEQDKPAAGSSYTYQILASNCDGGDLGPLSNLASIDPYTVISASDGSGAIELSWTSISSATYKVERKTGSGSYTQIATPSTNSYSDNSGTASTDYTYRVRAVVSSTDKSWSNEVTHTFPGSSASAPAAPTGLSATPGNAKVDLSWTVGDDNGDSITAHQICQKTGASPTCASSDSAWGNIAGSGATTNSHTVTGLTNGTEYTFFIRAVNSHGGGGSASVTGTPRTIPSAPTSLSATIGDGSVTLNWEPGSDGGSPLLRQQYCRKTGSACTNSDSWTNTGAAVKRTTIGLLTNGAEYHFSVRGVNDAGTGPAATVTATPVGPPSAPTGLQVVLGDGTATVSWTLPDDNGSSLTGQEYCYKSGSACTDISSWTAIGASSVSQTFSSLTNGVEYHFSIRGINGEGTGPAASIAGTPLARPSAPSGLTATPGNQQVTLIWALGDDGGSAILRHEYNQKTGVSYDGWTAIANSDPGNTNATSFTVTGLTNGSLHTFKVRAVNDVGDGAESSEVTATPAATPKKVRNFTATGGDGKIDLSWDPPTNTTNLTHYIIYDSYATNGTFDSLATVAVGTTTYEDGDLWDGITRWYRVVTLYSDASRGNHSEHMSGTTDGGAATKVQNFTATPGQDRIDLSWNAPAGSRSLNGYTIQFGPAKTGPFTLLISVGSSETSYAHTGLGNGATHWYRVQATDKKDHAGQWSDTISATSADVPSAPDLSGERGDAEAILSWTGNNGGSPFTEHEYCQKTDATACEAGDWTDISDSGEGGANESGFTVTGLTNGRAHTFRIRAVNVVGAGPASNAVTLTPVSFTGRVARNFTATGGDGEIVLTWEAPTHLSGYRGFTLEKSSSDTGPWSELRSPGQQARSHTDSGLTNGDTHWYRIKVRYSEADGGDGPWSEPISQVVGVDTTRVTGLTATGGQKRIELSWTAPTSSQNVTHYEIESATSSDGTFTELTTVTGTTYSHTDLGDGVSHWYKVRAEFDDGMHGGYSAIVKGTTEEATTSSEKVTGLTATGGAKRIDVSWTAPATTSKTVRVYQLQAKIGSGNWFNLGRDSDTDTITTTSYAHTGLGDGVTRRYRVRAKFTDNTDGEWSDETTGTTNSATTTDTTKVRNLSATGGRNKIDLSWTAPSGSKAIKHYEIQFSSAAAGGPFTDLPATSASTTASSHTGLGDGQRRWYRVRVEFTDNAHGTWSDVKDATTSETPKVVKKPGAPLGLAANVSGTSVSLSWNAPSDDGNSAITGYKIEIDAGAGWQALVSNTESTTTTYTHTNREHGTRQRYRVFAINAQGTGPASNIVEAVISAVRPSPPTGVSATVQSSSTIMVNWAAPSNDGGAPVTSYQIEFSTDGSRWQVLETEISSTSQSYTHGGLAPATTYYYRVLARNRVGLSVSSDVAEALTEADLPDPPTGLMARTAGADAIDLRWRAPEYTGGVPVTGYLVEYSEDAIIWLTAADHIETLFFQHTGLEPKTKYFYRVSAVNRVGHSEVSNIVNATTDANVPGRPTNLGAIAVSRNEILLGWTAPEDDGGSPVEGYRIEVSLDEGATWRIVRDHTDNTNTAFRHGELEPNTLYRYRVAAINQAGTGDPSEIAEARTHGVPDAPVSLLAEAVSPTQINLWWAPPGYTGGIPVTGYVVEGSKDRGGTWEVLERTAATTSTYAHEGLRSGTVYVYRVSAMNGIGVGSPSETYQARTHSDVPEAPRNLSAQAEGPRRIGLRWREPGHDGGEEIEGYRIEVSTNNGETWTVADEIEAATSYTHGGLEPVTKYRYRIFAMNEVGPSPASAVAEATTTAEVPGEPLNLKAEAIGTSQVNLRWFTPDHDGGAPITGYRIETSLDKGNSWQLVTANSGTNLTSHEHTDLTAATTYRYRVAAINEAGQGRWSLEAEARTAAIAPDPPEDLTASAGSDDRIDLAWQPPEYTGGAPVTSYIVETSMDEREWEVLAELEAVLEYSHVDPARGPVWHYRVRAVNEAGTSEPSNVASAFIDDPVLRTDRVSEAILPWFMSAATGSAVRAISDRIEAAGRHGSQARVNVRNADNGLRGLADGATVTHTGGGISVWAIADLAGLDNVGTVDFDGQIFSVHAGLDGMLRKDVLVGVASNRSEGTFDFTDQTHDRSVGGELLANVTSMGPYAAWIRDDVAVWAASGFGWGSITMSDSLAGERTSRTASSMLAMGGMKELGSSPVGAFGLQAEGWTSEMEIGGNLPSHLDPKYDPGHINESDHTVRQARLMLNWSVFDRSYGENRAELKLRGGTRKDWNSAGTGVGGTELGGDVGFESSVFRAHGSGRVFVHQTFREWGVRGTIEIRSRDTYGLSLQFKPSYGATGDGIRQLWENGVEATGMAAAPESRLDIVAGWRPPGSHVTSFGRFDSATEQIVVGTRIRSSVDWILEGRHTEKGLGLMLKGQWTFFSDRKQGTEK